MMRYGFGNHAYGEDEAAARECQEGRIGGFLRE
jgi:hypothetical protein